MVLVARYSIFPSLHMQHSAASVVFCPWLHHQHYPLLSCTPHAVQIHLHPLMISVKNCWHRLRQGGGRRLIWIKLDRRVDTALKVSRPFMSRWQGVCVLGGSAWYCQRGLFESRRIFEAGEWKGVDHKARHTSNTPRHIFTLLFPCRRRVCKEGGVSPLWHGLQNTKHKIKHVVHKVDHRGLGVQKKVLLQWFPLACANKIMEEFKRGGQRGCQEVPLMLLMWSISCNLAVLFTAP